LPTGKREVAHLSRAPIGGRTLLQDVLHGRVEVMCLIGREPGQLWRRRLAKRLKTFMRPTTSHTLSPTVFVRLQAGVDGEVGRCR
jgi:hypothetical protein